MTPLWAPRVDRLLARRDVAGLIAALDYRDAVVRRQAAAALGAVGAAAALTPLLAATSDSDAEVRAQAVRALHDLAATVGGWRALPVLVDALQRPEWRALAVRLLGELGEPGATAPLLDLCAAPRPAPDVVAALTRIALAAGRDALEVERLAMVVGTRDPDPFRLRAIAAVLAALDEPGFVAPLLDSVSARMPAPALASDPQAACRWSALRERDDPQEARAVVLALLREHREAAVRGLVARLRGPLSEGEGDERQRIACAWLDELVEARDLELLRALLAEIDDRSAVSAARLILWRLTAASLPQPAALFAGAAGAPLSERPAAAFAADDLATLADMLARGEAGPSAQAARLLAGLALDGAGAAVSGALRNAPAPYLADRLSALLQADVVGAVAAREPVSVLDDLIAGAGAAAMLLSLAAPAPAVVPSLSAALRAFGVLAPPALEEALTQVGIAAAREALEDYRRLYGSGRPRQLTAELALLLLRREAFVVAGHGRALPEGEREQAAAAVHELRGLGEQAMAPLLGALRDWRAFQEALNRSICEEGRPAARLLVGLPEEIVTLVRASRQAQARDELAAIGADYEQWRAEAAAAARRRRWDG